MYAADGIAKSIYEDPARDSYRESMNKKYNELRSRKYASDRIYQLELEEIHERFDNEIADKKADMQRRGLSGSGLENAAVDAINKKRYRETERLGMKFGKGLSHGG